MDQHWESLLKQSFMGLDRKHQSDPAIQTALSQVFSGLPPDMDPKEQIALLASLKKVNLKAESLSDSELNLAPQQSLPVADGLMELVKKYGSKLMTLFLPEILSCLKQAKQSVPFYFLPETIEYLMEKPMVLPQFYPVLGNRGHWLIQLNPEWQSIQPSLLLEALEQERLGSWKAQSKLIKQGVFPLLFQDEPQNAWIVFRHFWDLSSLPEKKQLLHFLEHRVRPEYQDFLENLLDSKSLEIRRLSASLLAELPESGWSHRIKNRLDDWMQIKGNAFTKRKIIFDLPKRIDPLAARDGWIAKGRSLEIESEELIRSIFSLLPPRFWSEHFELDAEGLILIIERSHDAPHILSGIMESSLRYQAIDWQTAIGQFFIRNQKKLRWQSFPTAKYFNQIDEQAFQKCMELFLKGNRNLVEPNMPIIESLLRRKTAWSGKMTIDLIRPLCDWLNQSIGRYWEAWHYRGILKQGAKAAPPGLVGEINSLWPRNSRIWGNWEKEVEEFQTTLNIRSEIHQIIYQ